ncbi:MAG: amidohydrolase [Armatimonadetes bacterium]|nr:MAG: amidohydrolase [Armatimonadota bacterium]
MRVLFKNVRTSETSEPITLHAEDGRWTSVAFSEREADTVVDLEGGFVLPGFVDCHCHVLPMGLDLQAVDLSGCWTREEVLRTIADAAASHEDGWLLAVQYDQTRFPEGSHLTIAELDPVTKGIPTILRHSSGHAAVVNSAVLQIAGIEAETEDPPGGEIVRDPNGRPLGPLLENAMGLAYRAAPKPTVARMRDAILAAQRRLRSLGITCANDMATGSRGLEAELAAYRMAAEERVCRTRLTILWERVFGEGGEQPSLETPPEWLRVYGIKLFADGAIGAGTAAMTEEYVTGGRGMLIYEPEELAEKVRTADSAGYRVAIHSIGDRSTATVLDAIEQTPRPSRHRVEHVMVLDANLIERIQRLGIAVTLQPEFLLRFGHAYKRQLGAERAARLKPLRTLRQAGIPVGLSSDLPIVPGDPWDGIRTAAARPEGFDQEENLTLEEAVEGYTRGAALANGDEDQGVLGAGCWADFQVYDKDPIQHPDAKLVGTFVAASAGED